MNDTNDLTNEKYAKNNRIDEISFQAKFASSCGDCTGLIPSGQNSDAELESYEDIYPYLPPFNEEVELQKRAKK